MKDNIKPDHYRKGEIDLYEAFSQIFPHNEYRAGMQMIAMRYMFRDKNDRVEDISKAIYTLERLKDKEVEHADESCEIEESTSYDGNWQKKIKNAGQYLDEVYFHHDDLLRRLESDYYEYLTRDENGELWAHSYPPTKQGDKWCSRSYVKRIYNDNFPEVKWSDEEPTKIADLLETYQNGGESGK